MEAAPKPVVQPSGERCSRCLQPVTFQSRRCEHCGHPLGVHRDLTIWIGAGGVGALLFLVALMWMVVRNEDAVNAPLPVEQTEASQKAGELPKVSDTPAKPEKPEKQPPLNK